MRIYTSLLAATQATLTCVALFVTPLAGADSLHITGRILPSSCFSEQPDSLLFQLNSCPGQARGARITVDPVSIEKIPVPQLRLLETKQEKITNDFSLTYQIVEQPINSSTNRSYLVSVIYP